MPSKHPHWVLSLIMQNFCNQQQQQQKKKLSWGLMQLGLSYRHQ